MKNNHFGKRPLKGLWVLIVGCMLVFNSCEKDIAPNQPEEDIKTVSVNEALRFLETHQSQRKVKSGKQPYVTIDADNIHHEEIVNSNQKMTVIPATTVNQGDYSRVLMLKIDGELKTSVFSMYPDECCSDSLFSGKIFITDLEGKFINGYRISEGLPVSQFVLKKNQRRVKEKPKRKPNTGQYTDIEEVLVVANIPFRYDFINPRFAVADPNGGISGGGGGGGSWNYMPTEGSFGDPDSTNNNEKPDKKEEEKKEEKKKKTPCEKASFVGKHTKTKALMKELQGKVNDNKEHGYVLKVEGLYNIKERGITETTTNGEIAFDIPEDHIDGYIHSHYKGFLSVFSPRDIFAIVQIYKKGKIGDLTSFIAGLVTAKGTQYLMVIDDEEMFKAFADKIWVNGKLSEKEVENNEILFHAYGIRKNNKAQINEPRFIRYLSTSRCGLKLLKGTKELDSWSTKKLNKKGKIVSEDC